MKKIILLLSVFACLFASCKYEPVVLYTYNANPKYSWGYVEFFGKEYADYGITNNVLSVSLFSDSLSIDSVGSLQGLGQFLFLEDVYVAPTDTLLPVATYTISNSHEAYTVSPGKNDTVGAEIFPIGAYISYYEANASKSTLKFISEGTFTVSRLGANYTIVCNLKTADKKALKGAFYGKLPQIDESLIKQSSRSRRIHRFLKL
jgi:hypothetical protein